MSSPTAATESIAVSDPPQGWNYDEEELLNHNYWTDKPCSIKNIIKHHYGLLDALPIWARDPKFGVVLIIFQASPSTGQTSYYVWDGIESTVSRFEAEKLEAVKNDIDAHGGGQGFLGKVKLAEVPVR